MSERKSTSIQFGPLWLRNMAQAQSDKKANGQNNDSGGSRSGGQQASAAPEPRGSGQATAAEALAAGTAATSGTSAGTATTSQNTTAETNSRNLRLPHAQTLARLQLAVHRPGGREASTRAEPGRSGLAASAEAGAPPTTGASSATTGSAQNTTSELGSGQSPAPPANPLARLQLASHRYGREEMLALCESSLPAPIELKQLNLLYHPREKHPLALNAFADDTRGATPRSSAPAPESGRGVRTPPRSLFDSPPVPRQRGRLAAFQRSPQTAQPGFSPLSSGSGARTSGTFNTGTEEEASPARPWSASNGGAQANRPSDAGEWAQSKLFRRRPNHTMSNWRQTSREEGDEWTRPLATPSKSHGRNNLDKWADREWGESERRSHGRSQPWNANRRTWVSGDTSDDKLPEWAMDNVEPGAGTFDASGAFHGYSHDDSNLQTNQESPSNFALTRSHTHGSFSRSNAPDDGSDEWWTSDKAKKLSPKRYNILERKPKRVTFDVKKTESDSSATEPQPSTSSAAQQRDKEHQADSVDSPKNNHVPKTSDDTKKPEKFSEGNKFGAHSDIGYESNEDRGFQSVMITATNDLRQRHQNLVTSTPEREPHARRSSESLYQLLKELPTNDNELDESAILDGLLDMTLNDSDIPKILAVTTNPPTPASPVTSARPVQMPNLSVPPPNMIADMTLPPPPNMSLPPPPNMAVLLPNVLVPPPNMLPPVPPPNMTTRIPSPGDNAQAVIANPLLRPSVARQVAAAAAAQGIGLQNHTLNSALGLAVGGQNSSMMQNPQRNTMSSALHPRQAMAGYQPEIQNTVQPMTAGQPTNSLFTDHANLPAFMPAQNSHIAAHDMAAQNSQDYPVNDIINRISNANLDETWISLFARSRAMSDPNRLDEWYYEDPQRQVQGPFSSREMLAWYEAGFFTPDLMVRRGWEPLMRPLGSYGPVVPFTYDVTYQNAPGHFQRQVVPNPDRANIDEALWAQQGRDSTDAWNQRNAEMNNILNSFPPYFWNYYPSVNSMNLPAEIVKEMKTEDEILAQLRAKSNTPAIQSTPPHLADAAPAAASDDKFDARSTPDLETLQRLMQSEALASTSDSKSESEESETKSEKPDKTETILEPIMAKTQPPSETKPSKQTKSEQEKSTKTKDTNNVTKTKNKKNKDEKKEEADPKPRKEDVKSEKASVESSPSKSKKEDKQSKKELEKEKKEWLKEGFTIVKGSEKNNNKENKKNAELTKAVDELERKKKEQEKLASDEEKKKRQADAAIKKQQQKLQEQEQHQRQLSESLAKRAPWSVSSQEAAVSRAGLTLAEIQRLEREKKLEQMKEQQHMMHLIAQQQAAALAREQEMQANLAWAKNNLANNGAGPSLAEIQAETRRKSAAAAAVATQSIEEVIPLPPLNTNPVPWGNSTNGGGFWDTQPPSTVPEKPQAVVTSAKPVEPKMKKKPVPPPIPIKREASPTAEFEGWCSTALTLWRSKIDVPTFVGFLKDIESPYEVKDYVKCYLGDTKDSSDFARQFLEKRSKLLRVGMVTPSDDLCSPAIAINPRAPLSDYQEVKGKGKKSKKNKMLKVDARILGFSVTASEDRINVGDIDTV